MSWADAIHGTDQFSVFADAARARLRLAGWQSAGLKAEALAEVEQITFSNVRQGSGLEANDSFSAATHLLLNPPFCLCPPTLGCEWGSGSVNSAACFLEHAAKAASSGAKIIAILPEVIRCGSRYEAFRASLDRHLRVTAVRGFGRFDPHTDVDVFVLEATVKSGSKEPPVATLWTPEVEATSLLSDYFNVSVGPVVDYRDPREGQRQTYLTARNTPRHASLGKVQETRVTDRPLKQGPFVVIKRTSRVSDPSRAVATLIAGRREYAIDNHLIVCSPKDGRVETCRHLMRVLKSSSTDEWLDASMRCRHLTVGSVHCIPWTGGGTS